MLLERLKEEFPGILVANKCIRGSVEVLDDTVKIHYTSASFTKATLVFKIGGHLKDFLDNPGRYL